MDIATISAFRKQTKKYFNEVHEDHVPLLLTRSDGAAVVIIPVNAYSALVETEHLLRDPVNAARLRKSVADAKAGKVKKHKLIDE